MVRNKSLFLFPLLCGLAASAAAPAWAQGFRFGGGFGGGFGGPRFDGPRFDGPRFNGPGYNGPGFNGPAYDGSGPDIPVGPPPPLAERGLAGPGAKKCFNAAETRERVGAQGLLAPFQAMRRAALIGNGEVLAGKLCRWENSDIYDISLLRPNGRVVHLFMDAVTGRVVGSLNAH